MHDFVVFAIILFLELILVNALLAMFLFARWEDHESKLMMAILWVFCLWVDYLMFLVIFTDGKHIVLSQLKLIEFVIPLSSPLICVLMYTLISHRHKILSSPRK